MLDYRSHLQNYVQGRIMRCRGRARLKQPLLLAWEGGAHVRVWPEGTEVQISVSWPGTVTTRVGDTTLELDLDSLNLGPFPPTRWERIFGPDLGDFPQLPHDLPSF